MEEVKKFLQNLKPRKYQEEIFKVCKGKNCIVVLPTGLGKTLIALMLSINRLSKHPDQKVVFLAPTRPLAEQHINYYEKNLPELFATMELFTGKTPASQRKKLWQNADIIFSTPQCIDNDIKKNLYSLTDVSLLIVDECHRCLKNYAYTNVARVYNMQAQTPRILGLTASPGHERKKIKQICKNLNIEQVEIRTRESKDVKEYLQKLTFDTIRLDFPPELVDIQHIIKNLFDQKVEELKRRRLLFGFGSKKNLFELQKNLIRSISNGTKNFNVLVGISTCAQAIKIQHALELLETQTLSSVKEYFLSLFKQAEQKKSKAAINLAKRSEFNLAYSKIIQLLALNQEHPKLNKLQEIIKNKIKENAKIKVIIFAQYRATVSKICKELNKIENINAKVFIGQAKTATQEGLSQKQQKEIIEEFSIGKVNILCSTSIGEEGLDIPEVDAVIFYEPIPSAIRQIQRRGRTARLQAGQLIMLITKKTRDEAYYWAAFSREKEMHKILGNINEELQKTNKSAEQKTLN